MNKMILYLFCWGFCISLIFISSCKTQQDTVNTLENINSPIEASLDTIHTSKNSLDWVGSYSGILNSSDNKLIEYKLTIDAKSKFILEINYPNSTDSIKQLNGKFSWNENENQIFLESVGFDIRVLENVIEITNQHKKQHLNLEIESAFLYKVKEKQLTNRFWILSNINGSTKSIEKQAYIVFKLNKRAAFNGGCNKCQNSFNSNSDGKLEFEKAGICTKMFCPEESHVEKELLNTLKNTSFYEIRQDTLILKDNNKETLASFNSLITH